MELKQGYKQTDVGAIPEDWDLKLIGNFTEVSTGGTPSTVKSEYWGGDIRWMNSGELNLKKVNEVHNRITEIGLNNSATKIIPKNCILIGLAGQGKTRGTVAINKVELCTNQSIAAIYPNNSFSYDYLYFNLDSRYNELRGLSTGDGGRGGLNLRIIKNLLIPIPQLTEQTAIANALSNIDELISQTEKLIDKKKSIKQGVMQELLKPKDGWVTKKLGEVIDKVTTGKLDANAMKQDGDYRFYTCAREYYFINHFAFDDEALLISGNGANVGYIHYYKGKFNAYLSSFTTLLAALARPSSVVEA
jgi:restriction endonuclease S subunit